MILSISLALCNGLAKLLLIGGSLWLAFVVLGGGAGSLRIFRSSARDGLFWSCSSTPRLSISADPVANHLDIEIRLVEIAANSLATVQNRDVSIFLQKA